MHYYVLFSSQKEEKKTEKKNRSTIKGVKDMHLAKVMEMRKQTSEKETDPLKLLSHEHQSAHANQDNQSISFHETVKFGSAAQKFR